MKGRGVLTLSGLALGCALLAAGAGCSAAYHRAAADKEIYGIIKAKSAAVPGMPADMTIDQVQEDHLKTLPEAGPDEILETTAGSGVAEAFKGTPLKLTLAKALEIAALNSRDLQDQKESLYFSAMSLTLQRRNYSPRFFGGASADYENTRTDEPVSIGTSFGFSWLFKTGTRLSVDVATTLSMFLTGNPREVASSVLDIDLVQPLLRGRGLAARESLTQAERNTIYALRSYVRFRRRFFVGIASDYYRVLEQRQTVQNEQRNYQNLVQARERVEMMAEAGRVPAFAVDQTRQDELRAEDRLQSAVRRYRQVVDDFKLDLALPIEAEVVLDPSEMERSDDGGSTGDTLSREESEQLALANRLDLLTAADEMADAERKVEVARNDLLPGLDVALGSRTSTHSDTKPLDLDFGSTRYSAGLDLDLPLDIKDERNAHRRALINLERARRDHEELHDRIVLQVRDNWRSFHRARSSNEIGKNRIALAERRVESTSMLLEAGRVETLRLLEAQEDLLEAQNALARSMVSYRIARMELARDMETLVIHDNGSMEANLGS